MTPLYLGGGKLGFTHTSRNHYDFCGNFWKVFTYPQFWRVFTPPWGGSEVGVRDPGVTTPPHLSLHRETRETPW